MVEELTDSLMWTFSGEGRRPVGDQIVKLYNNLQHIDALKCSLVSKNATNPELSE